ncbi:hypothetical protein MHYP_G00285390 [Metynnis hypsauchen]
MLSFIVVPKEVQAILRLVTCEKLNLVKRVLVVESGTGDDHDSLMQEYSDLFKGLGCLPGIASAPEVYHKTIHLVYEHIEGVDTSMDDIIVWGATKEEHDSRLKQVLEATRKANLKLNRDKCQLGMCLN